MTTEDPTQADNSSRGAIIQLFGVILIILGTLDSMLMWRGGFTLNFFYIGLIASGLFLFMIGKIRRRNGT